MSGQNQNTSKIIIYVLAFAAFIVALLLAALKIPFWPNI